MKAKKVRKSPESQAIRNYKAGLLDATQSGTIEKLLPKKRISDLSAFFFEDSLTDYEFNINMRMYNY